jgi:hypothetical protein
MNTQQTDIHGCPITRSDKAMWFIEDHLAPFALLFLLLILLAGLGTGCTTAVTEVRRETVLTNGVVVIDSTVTRAKTFADGKNKLSDFKAGQTKTTQSIGIGEQSGESTSEAIAQAVNGFMALGRLGAMFQGIPLPAPAPVATPTPK